VSGPKRHDDSFWVLKDPDGKLQYDLRAEAPMEAWWSYDGAIPGVLIDQGWTCVHVIVTETCEFSMKWVGGK